MGTIESIERGRTQSWAARAGVAAVVGLVVLGSGWARAGDGAGPGVAAAQSAAERVAVPATATPPVVTRPVVVLYGDSLAWEARDQFTAAFAGLPDVQVTTRTFGGTAPCDWLEHMRDDAASLRPGAVVVEFSGNALTPCMRDLAGQPLTGDAYLARYRADTETVLDIFEPYGTRVYFAGSPMPDPARVPGARGNELNAMYTAEASSHPTGVEYVDAGAAVLDHGAWTNTLPCVADEPCTGGTDATGQPVNVVRAPDSAHFCPVNKAARAGVTDACPVWSSGAMRFGRAMAAPVTEALSRGLA